MLIAIAIGASRWPAFAAGQAEPSLDGAYSAAQAARGEATFKDACTACHNIDDMAGERFRASWKDQSAGDLLEFLANAMPQGDPGSLTADEYVSIIAYFLSRSGYVAGERDLPADKTELARLRIAPLVR
ncbi:MAG: c-type cytochrome [Vicinamibacterales bacterium]